MLIIISPAKTLDYDTVPPTSRNTLPAFLEDSAKLIGQLQKFNPAKIAALMKISPKLAALNRDRYQNWTLPFTKKNAKQAIFAFKGDVYSGLNAETLDKRELDFAQKKLRILSGLYGLLRPLDLMQPYRLEMGTPLKNNRGKDLYEFWDKHITEAINMELTKQKDDVLINLASNEYFKSIKTGLVKARIITPVFKDWSNGQYKVISFFAKKARGLMSRYIIQNLLSEPEYIKKFNLEGYQFSKTLTEGDNWVFTRKKPI